MNRIGFRGRASLRPSLGAAIVLAAVWCLGLAPATAQQPESSGPPRPPGYETLSDAELYRRLAEPILNATGPAADEAMRRLTREERRWMRAVAERRVEGYLADRDAGRLASPPPTPPVPVRAPEATPSGEERFTVRNRADLSLGELARLSDPRTYVPPMDKARYRRDHCGRLYVIFDRMEVQDQQRTAGYCGTRQAFEAEVAEYNRQIAYLEGLRPPPQAAYAPSLAERAAAVQPGSSSVRVYDGRTGAYLGTEVMSDHEAQMRGARPQ